MGARITSLMLMLKFIKDYHLSAREAFEPDYCGMAGVEA